MPFRYEVLDLLVHVPDRTADVSAISTGVRVADAVRTLPAASFADIIQVRWTPTFALVAHDVAVVENVTAAGLVSATDDSFTASPAFQDSVTGAEDVDTVPPRKVRSGAFEKVGAVASETSPVAGVIAVLLLTCTARTATRWGPSVSRTGADRAVPGTEPTVLPSTTSSKRASRSDGVATAQFSVAVPRT